MIDLIFRYDSRGPARLHGELDAAAGRATLEAGNRAFAALQPSGSAVEHTTYVVPITAQDLGFAPIGNGEPAQEPFAIVLGCADARVPTELVFLQGANDLFVLRVAGNVLGESVLGSIDFAVTRLPTVRLVLVLGHTGCGAVTSAVDAFVDPANYLALAAHRQLRGIVNHILPAARVADEAILAVHGLDARKLPGFRAALTDCTVAVNAALVATSLRQEVPAAREGRVEVVWSVYDLATRRIGLPGAAPGAPVLRDPLPSFDDFSALAADIAATPRIAGLLTSDPS